MSETTTELHIHDQHSIDTHEPDHGVDVHGAADESARPLSPRDEMMKLIHARREEAINRELRFGEDLADEARENSGLERRPRDVDDDDDASGDQPSPLAEDADQAPAPAVEEPAAKAPSLRSINIDGQMFNVTEDQYRQLAEVGIRTNVAMSRAAAPNTAPPTAPAQEPARPASPRPAVLSKEDADAVAERLLYGGKDQVAQTVQALAEHIAAQTRQEAINPEAITTEAARRATQQAMEQAQLQYDLQVISGEYPTIWADRALGELAALQLSHVRREDQATGQQRTNLDAYREACGRTLDAIRQPRPGVTNPSPPATQATPAAPRETTTATTTAQQQQTDRNRVVLERKRVAPAQPTAVDRRASTSQAPRTKTGSEIVEMMRKSRGQMAMS